MDANQAVALFPCFKTYNLRGFVHMGLKKYQEALDDLGELARSKCDNDSPRVNGRPEMGNRSSVSKGTFEC